MMRPEAGGARAYSERLTALGILCKHTHEHTTRLAPPLVITQREIVWALDRMQQALVPLQNLGVGASS